MTTTPAAESHDQVTDLPKVRIVTEKSEILQAGFPDGLMPNHIAYPRTREEVQELVRYGAGTRTPLIPMGGGTAIARIIGPVMSGLAVSLAEMDKILKLSAENLTVTVEAGITGSALNAILAEHNLFLPVAAGHPRSTIGGQLARNHSGKGRYRYGSIRDHVLGATFVTPGSVCASTGGQTAKNVSGYDLTQLFSGSWGTLGILTSLTLRLTPKPETEMVLYCRFAAPADALDALSLIPLEVRRLVDSINVTNGFNRCVDTEKAGCSICVFLSGSREKTETVSARIQRMIPDLNEHTGKDASCAPDPDRDVRAGQPAEAYPAHALAFDRRETGGLAVLLTRIAAIGGTYDADLSSGFLEYSLAREADEQDDLLGRALQGLTTASGDGIRPTSQAPPQGNSVLVKLADKIDPDRIMFPANRLTGRFPI